MAKVIKFEKPQEKGIEEEFLETLTDWQANVFSEILAKIASEYNEMESEYKNLESKYIRKIAECENLRMENEILKEAIKEK